MRRLEEGCHRSAVSLALFDDVAFDFAQQAFGEGGAVLPAATVCAAWSHSSLAPATVDVFDILSGDHRDALQVGHDDITRVHANHFRSNARDVSRDGPP